MRILLVVLMLSGCDTLTSRRDFECKSEVEGKEVDATLSCSYETGREERQARGLPKP